MTNHYSLLDSGDLQRLERFGDYVLARPCSQALWQPCLKKEVWDAADATFSREVSQGWTTRKRLPREWVIQLYELKFKIAPTDFGHVGVFPEHSLVWNEMRSLMLKQSKKMHVLNLFAYSGGATLAAAQAGARVCHLDASKGMVSWAREKCCFEWIRKCADSLDCR